MKGKEDSSPEKDTCAWKPLMESALLVLFKMSFVVGGMSATSFDDTLLFRHSSNKPIMSSSHFSSFFHQIAILSYGRWPRNC